jgi:hypothetical protein
MKMRVSTRAARVIDVSLVLFAKICMDNGMLDLPDGIVDD